MIWFVNILKLIYAIITFRNSLYLGYGQNGDKPKRRQTRTATSQNGENTYRHNGDELERRQPKRQQDYHIDPERLIIQLFSDLAGSVKD